MDGNDTKSQLPLLDQRARRLLARFGDGSHTPGSGCAAALMGLLAAQLILTVCKITLAGAPKLPIDLRYVAGEMDRKFVPRLQDLFQQDADLFNLVIEARRNAKAAEQESDKRRWNEQARARLRDATEVVLNVADLGLELIDFGIVIFDHGAKKVRGDSGAAISAAIAGVSSSIFVTNLNLQKFRSGEWARSTQARINVLRDEVTARQSAVFQRVASLQAIELPEQQLPLLELMDTEK